jgi:hypothetical protein
MTSRNIRIAIVECGAVVEQRYAPTVNRLKMDTDGALQYVGGTATPIRVATPSYACVEVESAHHARRWNCRIECDITFRTDMNDRRAGHQESAEREQERDGQKALGAREEQQNRVFSRFDSLGHISLPRTKLTSLLDGS